MILPFLRHLLTSLDVGASRISSRVALALAASLTLAQAAPAGEACYVLVFAAQRIPNDPNYAHTWATFVKATWAGDGPCPVNPIIDAHTISWLPVNGVVRTRALCPETGRNYELHETIRWALDNCERVSLWGAYQIEEDLYCRALRQAALLESGTVRYKADDIGRKSDRVSNCIHAVSSIVEGHKLRVFIPGWGEMASYYVVERFMPSVIGPDRVHPWVGSALGLDEYPINYRDFTNPRSGAILGPAFRLFGGERELQTTYGPPMR